MTESTWRAWAREARRRGPRCLDLEALRSWVEGSATGGASTDPSWRATEAHVRECVRCSLEAEELRSFFGPTPDAEGDRGRAETERIRDLLARTLATDPLRVAAPAIAPRAAGAAGAPVRAAWRRRPLVPALGMALLIGVGLVLLAPFLRQDRAPSVPVLEPGQGNLRGDIRPRLLAPRGAQSSVPRRFAWDAAETPPGGWIFRLERVDGSLIWSTATRTTSVELPAAAAAALRPGSSYVWRLQVSGGPSPPASASFEIVP